MNISFNKNLTILHGQNGTGKSTLIHILANVANCDFIRFAFLDFLSITVTYSDKSVLKIISTKDREISIVADNQETYTFSKREVIETIHLYERDEHMYNRNFFKSHLIDNINSFIEENNIRKIGTSYFPAFRTMLEAWSSQSENKNGSVDKRNTMRSATKFSRNLFGPFLPEINFPSPLEIENNLRSEIKEAQIRIARYESSIFSDSFVKVFSALLSGKSETFIDSERILSEISDLTTSQTNSKLGDIEDNSQTYKQLQALVMSSSKSGDVESSTSGALAVYRDALKERQNYRARAFEEIDKYFRVVNSFLDRKVLSYELDKEKRIPRVGLEFPDGSWSRIQVMSSGERQLLTMLYAVNKMSGNSAVLIDEPELSLHIDWQEDLLNKMMDQLGGRQIIVCTHSPSIAEDFDEYMIEVCPKFNDLADDFDTITFDCDEDYL
nr:AAA family ATPase [Vibrio sp. 2-2(8)]